MCGRTACTLAPTDLCRSCGHYDSTRQWTDAQWKDAPNGAKYFPSHNVCPTNTTPVLLSSQHFDTQNAAESQSDWVIQPMQWGLVPSWHSGDPRSVPYKMNNARSDGLLSKRTFKVPLEKGQRCVVIVDGYYEWFTGDAGGKQPYFLYFPPGDSCNMKCDTYPAESNEAKPIKKEIDETKTVTTKTEYNVVESPIKQETPVKKESPVKREHDEKKPVLGFPRLMTDCSATPSTSSAALSTPSMTSSHRLLTMAGLFDVWQPRDGGPPLYTYSVITVDADPSVAWIHHRMPAILEGEDEVRKWLDYKQVPLKEAMQLIRPRSCLTQHPVSSKAVGNIKNKSEECIRKVDLSKPKEASAGSKFMSAWLNKGTKRKIDQTS